MFVIRQVTRLVRNIGVQDSIKYRHVSGLLKTYSTNTKELKHDDRLEDNDKSTNVTNNINKSSNNNDINKNQKVLTKIEPKLQIIFTCKKCSTQNNKTMSKLAYQKGVVIIRCDGCKNNHLIADNLGWFNDMNKSTNIEKILASKGEMVHKIKYLTDGFLVTPNEESDDREDKGNFDESINESNKQNDTDNLDESKNAINSQRIKDT